MTVSSAGLGWAQDAPEHLSLPSLTPAAEVEDNDVSSLGHATTSVPAAAPSRGVEQKVVKRWKKINFSSNFINFAFAVV